MSRKRSMLAFAAASLFFAFALGSPGQPQELGQLTPISLVGDKPAVSRQRDVVYGRKFGTALTMDIFTPKDANGLGAIFVVSGGWFSGPELLDTFGMPFVQELTGRGYTVFAVLHGCMPKFTIPEILEDMHRSVRFIRHHADKYKIDPERLGITGGSAGGHLSLMQGLAGDKGDPKSKDPIAKESSRVGAVGCFFPPTDFFNYGKEGENALGKGILTPFKAAFDFREFDKKTNTFIAVTDPDTVAQIGRNISPVHHVSADDPPTLIIHGDADKLVPIQQAEVLLEKLKAAGVETKLVTKPGLAHGWPNYGKDVAAIADWFDRHLKKGKS